MINSLLQSQVTLKLLGERKDDLISFVDALLEIIKIYLAIADLYDDDEDLENTGKTLRKIDKMSVFQIQKKKEKNWKQNYCQLLYSVHHLDELKLLYVDINNSLLPLF